MKIFKDTKGWPLILLVILFSSCSSGITGTYLDNQGKFMPINDSLLQLEKAGEIQINRDVPGNPLNQKIMVKFDGSFTQKYKIAKHNGTLTTFYILIALTIVLIAVGVWYGNNPGRWKGLPIVLGFAAVLSGLAAAASIEWAHTKEFELPKITYDSLQNTPGGVAGYIDQHLYE